MKHYKYLIVGGGMTADAAARGIRELDPNGSIGMISIEADPPYARPPLSKGMWKGRPFEKIWRGTDKLSVDFHPARRVTELNPSTKRLRDAHGDEYAYDKPLLATGGTPARLPFGDDHIIYFRTLQDYERLRGLAEQVERFAVIGGGVIGSESAAALAINGKKVTLIFPSEGIGANIFPRELSLFLNDFYRQKGVELLPKEFVVGLDSGKDRMTLKSRSG